MYRPKPILHLAKTLAFCHQLLYPLYGRFLMILVLYSRLQNYTISASLMIIKCQPPVFVNTADSVTASAIGSLLLA